MCSSIAEWHVVDCLHFCSDSPQTSGLGEKLKPLTFRFVFALNTYMLIFCPLIDLYAIEASTTAFQSSLELFKSEIWQQLWCQIWHFPSRPINSIYGVSFSSGYRAAFRKDISFYICIVRKYFILNF